MKPQFKHVRCLARQRPVVALDPNSLPAQIFVRVLIWTEEMKTQKAIAPS